MSEITSSFLYNLPELVKDYIYTDPYFRLFPIIAEDEATIADDVDQALKGLKAGPTGKTGLCIIVNSAAGGRPIPNTPDTFSEGARVLFEIIEVPKINRDATYGTGQPGKVVAEVLAAVMKNFLSGDSGFTNLQFYEGGTYMPEVIQRPGADDIVIHQLLMLCNGGVEDTTAVVGTPSISNVSSTVTIVPGSGSDRTLYTTDGTRPRYFGDANTSNIGTVYSVPFLAGDGTVITARSFLSGYTKRGSLLATHTVSV